MVQTKTNFVQIVHSYL